jgi:succinoglycan biosynthesis transport protein ExoP
MNNFDDKMLRGGLSTLDEHPGAKAASFFDSFDQPETERHLRDYVHVLFRRKWTFFTFFLVVVTTVLLRTFLTTPIYRATVTLKIDDDRPAVILFDRSSPFYGAPSGEDYLQTMYKVLQTRNLARRVINALAQDKQIASSSALPAGLVRGDGDMDSGVVANFLSKVTVSPVPNTRLVMVGFDSADPVVAATTANVIARACTELNVETKSNATDWARDLLEKQLQEMKAKVERSEEALNKYAAQNNLVFATEDRSGDPAGFGSRATSASVPVDRLENLTNQLTQATAERVSKELLLKEAQQGSDEVLLSAIASTPLVESLRKEYTARQTEYARLSLVYKPDHPKMSKLKDEMKQLKSQASAEVKTAVATLKKDYDLALKRENFFRAAVDKRKKQALNMSDKMVQYQILKRDADTNKELYNGILQRLKETGVNANLARSNIQVIDKADVPTTPYKPDRKRNLFLALFIGFFGGLGLALFTDYLDNTIKTPDDVEKTLSLPALGVVPAFPKTTDNGARPLATPPDRKSSSLMEAYRAIGTYIQFASPERPPKVILTTSAKRSEGKTTTSVNLATILASSQGRGIIIDGDLRKPAVHKVFEVDNSNGLTAFLTGHTDFDNGLIQETRIPHLDVITAGIIPPNPSQLLDSSRMRELINALQPLYSFIIIDAPPVLGLSDTLILSTMTDGVMLVVRAGDTAKDSVLQTRKLLKGVNSKILGVVLNGARESDLRYGSYYYYYSYYYYEEEPEGHKTGKKKASEKKRQASL